MKLSIPLTFSPKELTPGQVAALQSMQDAFAQVAETIEAAPPGAKSGPLKGLRNWIDGYKSYIVAFLTIAGIGIGIYTQTVTIPVGLAGIMAALGFAANRSALDKQVVAVKTQTAEIVNAVVAPQSPAALLTAAAAPVPPRDTLVDPPAIENGLHDLSG
jgi:hypothetical protein